MYLGETIYMLPFLVILGSFNLYLSLSIQRWNEETQFTLATSISMQSLYKNEESSNLESDIYVHIQRPSDIGKKSAISKAKNRVWSFGNELNSHEEIDDEHSDSSPRRNAPSFPIPSNTLNINDETQKQIIANVNLDSTPDCPEIHESCQQPKRIRSPLKCSCSESCLGYGNCCPDAPYDIVNRKIEKNEECINFNEGIYSIQGHYMVSRCPDNWTNHDTKHLCETKEEFEHDPIRHLPVTSKMKSRTYRNLFCAVCNGDDNIVAWEIPKNCMENETNPFNFSDTCRKDFKHPNSIGKAPKRCHWNIISSCYNESASNDIKRKCFYYYQPYKFKDENGTDVVYKNKFCAICSGALGNASCPPPGPILGPPTYTPLAVLLDVDFSEGDTAVGKQTRCQQGYVFDPWMEECRSVFCGRLYEFKDGKCRKISSSQLTQHMPRNNTIDSDCFKVLLNSSGYVMQDNGTITLLINGHNLLPGEYESLQNESILVCPPESTNYIEKFSGAQDYLTITCLSISMCCLLVKIILFFVLPEPRKVPTLVVIFLSASLFIAQFLLLAGTSQSKTTFCVSLGVALHFFILASVFWTNVLAFDIWKTFSTVQKTIKCCHYNTLVRYTMYSWGIPLIIVFLASVIEWAFPWSQFSPKYGYHVCWISNRIALLSFFAAPLGAIVVVNITFFTMTAITISKTAKAAKFARQNIGENQVKFALYVKLALVMGLTWLFGFVSAYTNNIVMWYFFTVFNGLQGAYILLAFSHFRRHSSKPVKNQKSTSSGTKSSVTNSASSGRAKEMTH